VSDGQDAILVALILVAAVTGVGFAWGRRRSRAIALRVSRELERALDPTDATYTWIGGLIGFHARFEVGRGIREAKATLTLMPRHAPLYLPVALVLGRTDRLHVTLYLESGFGGEGHVILDRALRSPLLRIEGRERMVERAVAAGGKGYTLLATDRMLLERMEGILGSALRRGLVPALRHVALVPDLATLYVQVVPSDGAAEAAVRLLAEDVRGVGGSAGAARMSDQESDSGEEKGGMQ